MRTVVREPQLAEQLVEVPALVSLSLPVDAKEEDTIVAMASDAAGRTWFQVSGRAVIAGGGCRVRATPSGTPRRGTPPGMIVDVPSTMQVVFQQSKSYVYCAAIQFIDRVPDVPPVPQKGDSTLQSLNKVVEA